MASIRVRNVSKHFTPDCMSRDGKEHNRTQDLDQWTALKVEKTRRLDSWMKGVPAPPSRMSIILTNACNLRCKMCETPVAVQRGWLRLEDELTDEEWIRIVKEGAEMGVLEWCIGSRGEPFVRRELAMDILSILRKDSPGSVIELATNGSRFTEEILDKIVNLGLDRIQISLDSPNAAMHDWIRGQKGTFERVTRAIRKLRELRDSSARGKPWITTNAVLSGLNYDRLDEMVTLAARIGIDQVNITPLRVMESIRPQMEEARLVMDSEQRREAFVSVERAKRTADKYGVHLHFLVDADWEDPSEKRIDKDNGGKGRIGPLNAEECVRHGFMGLKCYEPWFTIAVDAQGNPGYCVAGILGEQRYNLRRHTLHDVWYGEYFLNVRSGLMDNRPLDACLNCNVPSEVITEGQRILRGLSAAKTRR